MGLDQWAIRIKKKYTLGDLHFLDCGHPQEMYYWRKVPGLHGFMENLYREKGGNEINFNCCHVRLDVKDLSRLERAVEEGTLPETQGFFFGEHNDEDMKSILDFIKKAREDIRKGYAIYYSSWW